MAVRASTPTVETIAAAMVGLIEDQTLLDLRTEDPSSAVELYFAPVRVKPLGPRAASISTCSMDGLYDGATGSVPTILYADDVSPARARFTLLHELGHHLLVTDAAHLLDDIDELAGTRTDLQDVEEKVCHQFAGRVLIGDELLGSVVQAARLRPAHIHDLHQRSNASWEAVAVRAATSCPYKAAVVLVREPGVVGFCAASSRLRAAWWPRGSTVAVGGPLDRALVSDQTARNEIYRAGLGFAEAMYCDSLRIHDGVAVAVLTDKPSNGRFDIPEEPEPIWKEREDFCERCNEERTDGWCDDCRGRFCPQCERCACTTVATHPTCPGCGVIAPRREGAAYCLTCEADGLG